MAAQHLAAGGFPLMRPSAMQFSVRDPGHTPVHGGTGQEGVENVVDVVNRANQTSLEPVPPIGPPIDGSHSLTADGYPANFGATYLLAVEYADAGPRAASIMTYSESGDPSSPHYADQDALFAGKHWKPVAFTEAEIATRLG
jgi:acyl-homoserine-lactone acylase